MIKKHVRGTVEWDHVFDLKNFFHIVLGTALAVLAMKGFMIPNRFMDGGITGITWDGVAFRAGLAGNSSIVAVNNRAYKSEVLKAAVKAAKNGKAPIDLHSGETRSFLEDGDELTLSARCEAEGAVTIGFGSCTGRVMPAG